MSLSEPTKLIIARILHTLFVVLVEHLPIFILMIIYLSYGFFIEYLYSNYNILNFQLRLDNLLFIIISYNSILFFIAQFGLRVFKNKIDGLYPKIKDIKITYLNFNRFAGFLVIYLLFPFMVTIYESLKKAIPTIIPFCYDALFMKLDYILHFNHHPWSLLSPILSNTTAIGVIDNLYITWFFLLNLFTFWLSWSNRRKLRMQFFMTNLLIFFIIGSFLATVFSSAGPCYYENVTGITQQNPYKVLLDKLHDIEDNNPSKYQDKSIDDNSPIIALQLQDNLWDNYINKGNDYLHYISAMPSVHVACATLFALTVSGVNIYLAIIFWIYWAIIQIGSVILGWHYAVDGYLATIVTIGLWKMSGVFINWSWGKLPEKLQIQILQPNLNKGQNKSG